MLAKILLKFYCAEVWILALESVSSLHSASASSTILRLRENFLMLALISSNSCSAASCLSLHSFTYVFNMVSLMLSTKNWSGAPSSPKLLLCFVLTLGWDGLFCWAIFVRNPEDSYLDS